MDINQEPESGRRWRRRKEQPGTALKMIEDISPDLVIVDLSLPGIDGIELIKTMKA